MFSRSVETTGSDITYRSGAGPPGDQASVSIKLEPQRRWKRHQCTYFTDVIRGACLAVPDVSSSASAVNGVDAERRSPPASVDSRVGTPLRKRRESLLTRLNFCGYRSVGLARAATNCLLAGVWIHGHSGDFV